MADETTNVASLDGQPLQPAAQEPHYVDVYDISGGEPVLGSLPAHEVQAAIASGQFSLPKGEVNVVSPDGEHGTLPAEEAAEAFKAGFQYATPDILKAKEKADKYGTFGQQAKTFAEAAARGATFGLSTGIETGLGIATPEDIKAREEENPTTALAGELAGLGVSALTPMGEGALLAKAGQMGARAVGLAEGTSAASRIGSAAVKGAIENGIFQGGNEVHKAFLGDPDQTVESIAGDVGLSTLLGGTFGGGLGGAAELWRATKGSKVASTLRALTDRVGGIEGQETTAVGRALEAAGLNPPAEIVAKLEGDPAAVRAFDHLIQVDTTKAGRKTQEAFEKFKQDISDVMATSLGREPSAAIPAEVSLHKAGQKMGEALTKEYEALSSPVSKAYDDMAAKYHSYELPKTQEIVTQTAESAANPYLPYATTTERLAGTTDNLISDMYRLAEKESWAVMSDSGIMQKLNKITKAAKEANTVGDLQKLYTAVGDEMQGNVLDKSMSRAGGMIKRLIKEAELDAVTEALGSKEGLEAKALFAQNRQAFADLADVKEKLQDIIGTRGSVTGYAKALKEMATTDAEGLAKRLALTSDAFGQKFISEKFPATAQAVREHHLDKLIEKASESVNGVERINPSKLLSQVEKMEPELKQFIFNSEQLGKLEALGSVVDKMKPAHYNYSNTARVLDKMQDHIPGSAVALAGMLLGHHPATALVTGFLAKQIGKEIPDAVRLGMLKMMGQNAPLEASKFRALTLAADAAMKAEKTIDTATKNLLKPGIPVLTERMQAKEKNRAKLDKMVTEFKTNPEQFANVAGDIGHYAPDQAQSVGALVARTMSHLSALKPSDALNTPLDGPKVANPVEKAAYNRALDIANQPLLVLQSMKEGRITPSDVSAVKTLYPALYKKLSNKIVAEIGEAANKNQIIPYKTRMGMSVFLGQPLDSTMLPQSILSAQPKPQQQPQQPASQTKANGLNKLADQYQTSEQARNARRSQ